mgnify:CR=1 FL=1
MAKRKPKEVNDIEECRKRILIILDEYNCRIETDNYHLAWLRDVDTGETLGFQE